MPARESGQCWGHVIWVNHQGMTERRLDSGKKTNHSRLSKGFAAILFAYFDSSWTANIFPKGDWQHFFHQPIHAVDKVKMSKIQHSQRWKLL